MNNHSKAVSTASPVRENTSSCIFEFGARRNMAFRDLACALLKVFQ